MFPGANSQGSRAWSALSSKRGSCRRTKVPRLWRFPRQTELESRGQVALDRLLRGDLKNGCYQRPAFPGRKSAQVGQAADSAGSLPQVRWQTKVRRGLGWTPKLLVGISFARQVLSASGGMGRTTLLIATGCAFGSGLQLYGVILRLVGAVWSNRKRSRRASSAVKAYRHHTACAFSRCECTDSQFDRPRRNRARQRAGSVYAELCRSGSCSTWASIYGPLDIESTRTYTDAVCSSGLLQGAGSVGKFDDLQLDLNSRIRVGQDSGKGGRLCFAAIAISSRYTCRR